VYGCIGVIYSRLVAPARIELATSPLRVGRSFHLSYGATFNSQNPTILQVPRLAHSPSRAIDLASHRMDLTSLQGMLHIYCVFARFRPDLTALV
jgi:hypothetical protein